MLVQYAIKITCRMVDKDETNMERYLLYVLEPIGPARTLQ